MISFYSILLFVLVIWLISKVVKVSNQVEKDHNLLNEILGRIQTLETRLKQNPDDAQMDETTQSSEQEKTTPPSIPGIIPERFEESPIIDLEPIDDLDSIPVSAATIIEDTEAPNDSGDPPSESSNVLPAVNWEQFMGVKLFAWIGGVALFLGVAFFVKYSFEHNLISPPVRVAIGLAIGLALMAGGLFLDRSRYAITVQTLCAAAILIFYADIFAACSLYHLLPNPVAFGLMVLITFTAFLLSVRLDAQAIAVLGMLGGFLTPPLLATGEDRPLALFSYIAMLDIGLLGVVMIKRWGYISLLAGLATIAMQFGWVSKFFEASKIHTAQTVFIAFVLLFSAALWIVQRKGKAEKFICAAACLVPAAALLFAFYLLVYPYREIAQKPFQVFIIVLTADVALLAVAWLRQELRWVNMVAGAAAFLLSALWISEFLDINLLNQALFLCLLLAVLHGAYPVILERMKPMGSPVWWGHVFAPAALLLTMIPLLKFEELSIAIWLSILVLNALAVILAFITAAVKGILSVLLITAAMVFFWLTDVPVYLPGLLEMLIIIGAFAAFFLLVSVLILRRSATGQTTGSPETTIKREPDWTLKNLFPADLSIQITAISALLPFLLLIMVVLKQPLQNPSPVFGLAILLGILLYGLVFFFRADLLAAICLLGVVCLEQAWFSRSFTTEPAVLPLAWLLLFYALFSLFPFLFQKQMAGRIIPWATAALAGPLQFFFVYRLIRAAYLNPYMGLLPTLFALPSLLALFRLIKTIPLDTKEGRRLSALFGGVALFFITAIFPIQFDKQWITIGWALEGAALLWLLRRVPHPGLKIIGTALLVTAFIRLSLNLEVIQYYRRSDTPILNWYLYAYGLVSLCLFSGARLLKPPDNLFKSINIQAVLYGLGTVLTFLLLNIEIADYFSTGEYIRFQFSGSFGRDMTYSLAWGIFSFIILLIGIRKSLKVVRYGGIGLLIITILKLFLHDLWSLGGLYRISALIGLSLVLIPVSFLYQRFLSVKPANPEKG